MVKEAGRDNRILYVDLHVHVSTFPRILNMNLNYAQNVLDMYMLFPCVRYNYILNTLALPLTNT